MKMELLRWTLVIWQLAEEELVKFLYCQATVFNLSTLNYQRLSTAYTDISS